MLSGRPRSLNDLDRAVGKAEKDLETIPEPHPERIVALTALAICITERFKQTGSIDDLNRAIGIFDSAAGTDDEHPDQAAMLSNLGHALTLRYERTGSIEDLKVAEDFIHRAVSKTLHSDPHHPGRLHNLAYCLSAQYDRNGSMDVLERAIEYAEAAVVSARDKPYLADLLSKLGNLYGRRFEQTGSMDDLNSAVKNAKEALTSNPKAALSPDALFSNLVAWLRTRFDRTGFMEDLNVAIEFAHRSVGATLQEHQNRADRLTNLGTCLFRRFERTGSEDDLNQALNVLKEAVDITPQDHHNRGKWLLNLGACICRQFAHTQSTDDLDSAIKITEMALEAVPHDHPNHSFGLGILVDCLSQKFKQTGSIDDIDRAINVTKKAVNATPPDHPRQGSLLGQFGLLFERQYHLTGAGASLNHALRQYKEGWRSRAPHSTRIHLATHAATILASQSSWKESSDLLQDAIELLPIVTQRRLHHDDNEHILAQFAGLASMAAAVSLKAGKDEHQALELLESGRYIIAGLLLEMRTDISDLKDQEPILAQAFESLRDELDSSSRRPTLLEDAEFTESLQTPRLLGADQRQRSRSNARLEADQRQVSQLDRRQEADQKLNQVIEDIRNLPEFQRFLLPPTGEELMAAAHEGPLVVINVSEYRCDAFLIEHHQIRVVPLPDLSEEELRTRINQLLVDSTSTLQWLWTCAAEPILQALGYHQPPSDDNWPRVWWIPTGLLSHFPIHAAGFHNKGSTETVLDRVMSSYASSVKALVYGRRQAIPRPAESASEYALLVAMPETLGCSNLPYATDEVEMLKSLCPSLQLESVIPPQHKNEVVQHLRACKIFHFAGHGRSDPKDPARSCLILKGENESLLTVGEIRDSNVQESLPFLSYLSACSTGVNKADKLVDEGIHLVSAFQLAGFRHVIGTLWEVKDSHCLDVAKVFYGTIRDEGMTDMAVCRGLHKAVTALRDRHIKGVIESGRDAELCEDNQKDILEIPVYWASYIHYGV